MLLLRDISPDEVLEQSILATLFGVKPRKPRGALTSCLEVKFRRSFVESCPKLASEWLQIGFKVAGIQKWLQNRPNYKRKGAGASRPPPLFCCVLYLEAILKPLWDACHVKGNLKEF